MYHGDYNLEFHISKESYVNRALQLLVVCLTGFLLLPKLEQK